MTPVTWQPEVCPTCNRVLEGLGRWCPDCQAYTADMVGATTDASPATRREVPDTRSEAERKQDARPTIEALGWIVWDTEQGYRPDACARCGEPYPGGHSTRVTTGFPDWVVIGHGIIAFLEWKSHTGKPTKGQRERASDCAVAGVPYAVVRTTTEAVRFLDELKRSA